VIGELPWPSLAPALMLIREAALDDGITKKLDELRWRQAARREPTKDRGCPDGYC
jgi:hypothetical protein